MILRPADKAVQKLVIGQTTTDLTGGHTGPIVVEVVVRPASPDEINRYMEDEARRKRASAIL